jgi:uncharacterized membrane protein YgcG
MAQTFGVDGNVMGFLGDLTKINAELLTGVKSADAAVKKVDAGTQKKRQTPDGDLSAAEQYEQNKQIMDMWFHMLKFEFMDPVTRAIESFKDTISGNGGNVDNYFDEQDIAGIKFSLNAMYVEPMKDVVSRMMGSVNEAVNSTGYHQPTVLERMFGKPEDFDIYKELWAGLSKAIGGAYDSIVSTAGGTGKAIKKEFAADMIEGLGKQALIQGLINEALAVADFFTPGKQAQAAGEAASGAALIGASVAAGIAAHELGYGSSDTASGAAKGGGGGGSGGGSAGTRTSSGGGSQSSGPQRNLVLVVTDDGIWNTPRARRSNIARQVNSVLGTGGP